MFLIGGRRAHPRRIGCWRVDPALADYLDACLRRRWSGLRLASFQDVEALQRETVDAWLLGETPRRLPGAPALVLGRLSRDDALEALGRRTWRVGLPSTGQRLLERLEAVLCA